MNIKDIDSTLQYLQEQLESDIESFKGLKQQLLEAKQIDQNADLSDIAKRRVENERNNYEKTRKEFTDTEIKARNLQRASTITGKPEIAANLELVKIKKQKLKAEKSNAFWDKVFANRKYKEEKRLAAMHESLEYDNLQKILQASEFLSQAQYGRVTINGEVTDVENPAGITQSADEFEQSCVGTEIEQALYLAKVIAPGYFLVLGVTGEDEPHVAYFYEEGDKIKIVDPKLGEVYDPRQAGKPFVSKDNMKQVIRIYTKDSQDYYQVFDNLDFLIGQPISLFQDLVIQHWHNGLLDLPSPMDVAEQEAAAEEQMQQEELAAEKQVDPNMQQLPQNPNQVPEQLVQQQVPVQEAMFWHEMENIPNNGANISGLNTANNNIEAKENALEKKIDKDEKSIENIKQQITEREENINSIKAQLETIIDHNSKAAGERRIKQLQRQIQVLNKKKEDIEQKVKTSREQKSDLTNESTINEAMTPVEFALSGSAGKIFNYLLTGTSTGDKELDYVANKMKDSAVVKNILFKYDRELNKVQPNKDELAALKLKLKTQINKFKKNK